MTIDLEETLSYLLLISLGPVQEFIASARQCQDLWYGSWLLSELSAEVANSLKLETNDTSLIFPADITPSKKEQGVANKILAVVSGDSHNVQKVASNAKKIMLHHLRKISSDAFDKVDDKYFFREVAEKQIEDLMEFLWVAVPFSKESNDGYQSARDQAEKLLAARKNSKNWVQPQWLSLEKAKKVPKSSLDGVRESVLDEKIYPQRGHRQSLLSDAERRQKYFIKGSERLCGIGLLKRVGSDPRNASIYPRGSRPVFHSTSHLAAQKLLSKIQPNQQELIEYFNTLQSVGLNLERFLFPTFKKEVETSFNIKDPLGEHQDLIATKFIQIGAQYYDGSLLFEHRVLSELKEQLSSDEYSSSKNKVQRSLSKLLKSIEISAPYPYYVMLLADGDKMGKALDELASLGLDAHREVSEGLEVFTAKSRSVVEAHGGSLIYSGGDDVLALLPLHTALQCSEDLKNTFSACIKDSFPDSLRSICPTLSIGLAICHHLQPMGEVRELAKKAEKLAKVQRNSLGIVFKKRGSSAIQITEPWTTKHKGKSLIERIWFWMRLFRDGILPHSTAFMLAESIEPLIFNWEKCSEDEQKSLQNLCRTLASGVLDRRAIKDSQGNEEEYVSFIRSYFEGSNNPKEQIQKLSTELQLAREMLVVWKEVWGNLPQTKEQEILEEKV